MNSGPNEKMMILKMLDEGKITLEEANELLEALEAGAEEMGTEKEDWTSDFKKGLQGLKDGMEKGISEAREGLQEGKSEVEKETEGLGGFLKSIFDSFSTGFAGPGYSFTDRQQGTFSENRVEVVMDTRNGSIDIGPAEGSEYEMTVESRVRGESEDKAREKKEKGLEIHEENNRLLIRVKERAIVANVRLRLPQDKIYDLNLDTSNGRIEARGLNTERVEGDTSNGRVVFQDMKGKIFRGDTSNGRVEMKQIKGEELIADTSNGSIFIQGEGRIFKGNTSNGSITIEPRFTGDGEVKADTTNGRIKINLPREKDIGYSLKAGTSMGSLDLEIPELEYSERQEGHSRKKVVAQSRDLAQKAMKVNLEASTSMGSLFIG